MLRWLKHPMLTGQILEPEREEMRSRARLNLGLGLASLITYALQWALVQAGVFDEPVHILLAIGITFLAVGGTCWAIAQPPVATAQHDLLCAALLAPLLASIVWCVGLAVVAFACAHEETRLYLKGFYDTWRRGLLVHPIVASLGFAYAATVALLLYVRLQARSEPADPD